MFGICNAECTSCQTADPVADRVKVDPARFAPGKENSPPVVTSDKLAEEERKLFESAEAERKRIEALEIERSEALEIERRRRAEAEAAARAEAERILAAEQRRLDPIEEQRRLEEECCLEEQRRLEEQKAEEAAAREERAKDEAATHKVQKFLKDKGFSGVNSKKTSLMSHKYALHAAVEKKDAETVVALLRCKADPSLQNSSKKTPEQLASSVNKKGSHDQVLTVLRAHAR